MQIKINQAVYGCPQSGGTVDVTAQVQALCDKPTGASVSIPVTFATFGIADPAPGVRKSLVVRYQTKNDLDATSRILYRMGVDGDTISIPCQGIAVASALEAVYGTPGEFLDITAQFNNYLGLNPGSGSIAVGSKDFFNFFCNGSDPASGIVKTLYLHLTFSGMAAPVTLVGNDGQTVSWTVG